MHNNNLTSGFCRNMSKEMSYVFDWSPVRLKSCVVRSKQNLIWSSNFLSPMQILSQANQSQSQQHATASSSSSSSSQIPPPPNVPPPPGLSPAQFILHSSHPLVGCTKTPPSLLHSSIAGGCAQTPPSIVPLVLSGVSQSSGDSGWDNESKDPDKVKHQANKFSFNSHSCHPKCLNQNYLCVIVTQIKW